MMVLLTAQQGFVHCLKKFEYGNKNMCSSSNCVYKKCGRDKGLAESVFITVYTGLKNKQRKE